MKTTTLKATGIFLAAIIGIVVALALVGCTENESAQEIISDQHQIVGTVSSISGDQMEVNVTSDSSGALQGPVRVDISAIDSAITDEIASGTEVEVVYNGQVGMSEPPFISAQSVTVL